jgi:hypothetical protein
MLTWKLILTAALTASLTGSAAILEQWKFEGDDPQTGVNGLSINKWTGSAPNQVISPKVLRYATPGNTNAVDLGGIDTSTVGKLVLTVMAKDIFIGTDGSNKDNITFQLLTDGGPLEVELNVYNNGMLTADIEQGLGSEGDLDVDLLRPNKHREASPLVMVATWDFSEKSMAFSVKGSANGSASAKAPNLAKVKTLNRFRVKGGKMEYGSFLDLYSVTIETVPSNP